MLRIYFNCFSTRLNYIWGWVQLSFQIASLPNCSYFLVSEYFQFKNKPSTSWDLLKLFFLQMLLLSSIYLFLEIAAHIRGVHPLQWGWWSGIFWNTWGLHLHCLFFWTLARYYQRHYNSWVVVKWLFSSIQSPRCIFLFESVHIQD